MGCLLPYGVRHIACVPRDILQMLLIHPKISTYIFIFFIFLFKSQLFLEASIVRTNVEEPHKPMNKHAISTIKSLHGDIIDCVPISKQPAFDHPLLKNHQIQLEPNFPHGHKYHHRSFSEKDEHRTWQAWHKNGVMCPNGTIPIKQAPKDNSPRRTKKKKPTTTSIRFNENGHEHAIAYMEGDMFYGAKARINVWNPRVETSTEFSLSQMWILGGSYANNDLNTIEAGWQVDPDLYGDNNTRLFIYWTSDSYQDTGCYNLQCPGFVQMNNEITLGASIMPISIYDNDQYDIIILIWKDTQTGNWWLQFGDEYIIGYWPSTLFTTLSKSANTIQWGGEVINSQPHGRHTQTQMGSGNFLPEAYGRCSYFSNLEVVDNNNKMWSAGLVNTFTDKSSCYNIQVGSSDDWGTYFYYGGAGKNHDCQ